MRRPSLRWLLLGSVLATITVGFAVFAVQLERVERHNRVTDIDDELGRAERNAIGGPAGPAGGPPAAPASPAADVDLDLPIQLLIGPDGSVTTVTDGGNPFTADVLTELRTMDGTQTIDDPNYRVRVTPTGDGAIAITALSLDELDAAVARFRTSLAVGGTALLVMVALVLWAITGYLLRPVARMTETATRIANGELDISVGEPSGSRETAELAVDLDLMLARLRSALGDAQQSAADAMAARNTMERFLADMSHELRTPLTALKGYSDLYAHGMLAEAADVDRAMQRIGSESDRLTELANGMLQLARSGAMREPASVFDLAEMLRNVAHDLRAAYPDQSVVVDVDDQVLEISAVSGQFIKLCSTSDQMPVTTTRRGSRSPSRPM